MFLGLQPIHWVIIIVVAILLFGGVSKLPEIGRNLGKGISEFRKGTKEATEGFKEEVGKGSETANAPAAAAQPAVNPGSSTPSPAAAPRGNFCIQCGAANPPEAHFCASCGAKLPEKTA
jgi:TatA/E family protein of Tat protein translocase